MIRTTPTLVTAPATEPVTLSEAKLWAKIDINDDDALITALIVAAREFAEKYLRRALITQTWRLSVDMQADSADRMPSGYYELPVTYIRRELPQVIELPYKPIQSISSVTTYSPANAGAVFASSNYFLDTASGRLVLNENTVWPSNMRSRVALEIVYVAGYGNAAAVPQAIKTSMFMHIQKMYDERMVCEAPPQCVAAYDKYKVYG